ncbi:MAG: hypothetical protein COU22_02965 [Candidatus Komeilibacteria bacterium CG10_big_fil_rev_8_21_14_0_10_41_13]|uniref:Thymidylate kinase-like domain-containing protein n=1 Tax=Candidatus Komeilibacteria bacterium CG10_big_fil_rev_8_21_14_0_10_41_13 TaxID=1974476 RepID=A0A2M6WBX3_9BACT|nr:MAG: hypothetical protein COU22_02965 [Candidatus Komeilibacteria bacterium CG10_big_fil_rev_8_21_14_0_10_41_13]
MEGLFIVLYGINNLGKSTQVERLTEALVNSGLKAENIKYPIYDLSPTGPQINEILRSGKQQAISEEEFQALYIKNRLDYQPQLCQKLDQGINIIAEDYIGTGLAWGWAKGADLEKMIEANKGLLKPDIEILLDGERFLEAKEEKHQHESNDQLTNLCRQKHLDLAVRFGWSVVNANQEIEEVHKDILKIIEDKIQSLAS